MGDIRAPCRTDAGLRSSLASQCSLEVLARRPRHSEGTESTQHNKSIRLQRLFNDSPFSSIPPLQCQPSLGVIRLDTCSHPNAACSSKLSRSCWCGVAGTVARPVNCGMHAKSPLYYFINPNHGRD